MSFSIFLTCFQNGEGHPFPRAIAEKAFAAIADRSDPARWMLANSDARVGIGDEFMITGLAINRPPLYPEFWAALIEILRFTPSLLYWPGKGCVVANQSTIAHVPAAWIEALGTPTVTTDMAEILELIKRA